MKVLQVTPYFAPAYAFGGTVKAAYQISSELVRRRHEVVVYTSDIKNQNTRLNIEPMKVLGKMKVYYMRNLSLELARRSKIFITPEIILKARNEAERFDIIHLHEYRTFQNIVLHHYARKYGIPYVLQAHGSLPRIMVKRRLKWVHDASFGYRLLRDASRVIALSRVEAQQYRHMGVQENKIVMIPNGIDLAEYSNLPIRGSFKKKFGIDQGERLVLYLGRINKIKGLDILVKAFARMASNLHNVKLVIVGPDDGYFCELQSLITALKIESKVVITGHLDGNDKLAAYVDAEVYVLPSRYETFPMGLLEAYACSKPVIASKIGGLSDLVIDNVTGILVESGNEIELEKSILSELDDYNRAREMGLRGRAFVEKNFSIEKVVDKLEQLYEDVITP
jgi:glycosyltransferase involved in cell wall biosynthesis